MDELITAKENYETLKAELDVLREAMNTARNDRTTKIREVQNAETELETQLSGLNNGMDTAAKNSAKGLIIAARNTLKNKRDEYDTLNTNAQSTRTALLAKEQEVAAAEQAYKDAQEALA